MKKYDNCKLSVKEQRERARKFMGVHLARQLEADKLHLELFNTHVELEMEMCPSCSSFLSDERSRLENRLAVMQNVINRAKVVLKG